MITKGSVSIYFRGECNCIGCFYTRTHGGYMPCQMVVSTNRQNRSINGQPIQPPKKP
ncbi:TPA: hypothetical protein ACSE6T_000978 [Acinetobacter baumannii]